MVDERRQRMLRPAEPGQTSSRPTRMLVSVVGIDDYTHLPRLDNAVSDARGVRTVLIDKLGFEEIAEPLFDERATHDALMELVTDTLRARLKPDDGLIFFFAGHGHTRTDQVGRNTIQTGYIAPVDAEADGFAECVEVGDLLDRIARLPARHILVILDACHSGIALASVVKHRSTSAYAADLETRVSRRVITSARADQLALDGGPMPRHSLFTGVLIQGLEWGKADRDGDGIISASDLGLYLQNAVGQHSESRQTPDFGAFAFDDRGELLIRLGENDFGNVRARAYSALQSGELSRFTALVERAQHLRPESVQTLYLRYRAALSAGDIREARRMLERLGQREIGRGHLPLDPDRLRDLGIRLSYWAAVFSLEPTPLPVELTVVRRTEAGDFERLPRRAIGEVAGWVLGEGDVFRFVVRNPTDSPRHVYAVGVTPAGDIDVLPLWSEWDLQADGIWPGETAESFPFEVMGESGLSEIWLITAEARFEALLYSPSVRTRAVILPISADDLPALSLHKLYLHYRSDHAALAAAPG